MPLQDITFAPYAPLPIKQNQEIGTFGFTQDFFKDRVSTMIVYITLLGE
jgi:hypothetical protein